MILPKLISTAILVASFIAAAAPKKQTELGGIPLPPTPKGSDGQIIVDLGKVIKPIGIHNAVCGAPDVPGSQHFELWKAAEFPYVRTHDLNLIFTYGGPYVIDVPSIFRNFDADETDPANYDFECTDAIIKRIQDSGAKIFYRLGCMFENRLVKKYTIYPPKDNAKWARICEHIIAHYNEGWANGYKYDIEYWEIWNEPNLRTEKNGPQNGGFWRGTRDQFKELFLVAVKHLKERFPNIKVGGPAMAGTGLPWGEELVKAFAEKKIPLDFYSWHGYATDPKKYSREAKRVRDMLDRNGFKNCESHFNEWNYVKGWTPGDFGYSREVESGRFNQKGAAYLAAAFCELQKTSVDMSMFYDARIPGMNNLFDPITKLPMRGYYPFIAWRDLRKLGSQVNAVTTLKDVYLTAAKNDKGDWGLFIVRYTDDNNETAPIKATIRLRGNKSLAGAECHLTDDVRIYTKTDLKINKDGSADLILRPWSYAFITFEK